MSETPDDARRLLARGKDMELANGSIHTVKFTARSLARIEDDYGSLEAFTGSLRAKPFNSIAYVIQITLGIPKERAIDLVDTKRLTDYFTAIGAALEEALPETEQGNLKAAPGLASPGAASSMSPSASGTSTPSASGT